MFSEDFGRLFSLPYTAVETSPNELGRLAVQALVQRMASPQAAGAPRVELVAPRVTDRGSIR
jgi:DNA-binding LacI/PurR family transcriptional regulator